MADMPITMAEAARRLAPYIARSTLYTWVERGDVRYELSPGGRKMVRESEVARVLAWYEGPTVTPQ